MTKLKDLPLEIIEIIIKFDKSGHTYRYLPQTCKKYYTYINKSLKGPEYVKLFKSAWDSDLADRIWELNPVVSANKYFNEELFLKDFEKTIKNIWEDDIENFSSFIEESLNDASTVYIYLPEINQYDWEIYDIRVRIIYEKMNKKLPKD
jgi:hypothetical protein